MKTFLHSQKTEIFNLCSLVFPSVPENHDQPVYSGFKTIEKADTYSSVMLLLIYGKMRNQKMTLNKAQNTQNAMKTTRNIHSNKTHNKQNAGNDLN